jgi:DNA-binding transcriptional LysR family regulator
VSLTFTQLNAFLAVVRGGSVTAAADELVVTQPSVSSAVAALGRELGCELFERSGRGIRLTDAGSAFVPYAVDVIGLLARGREVACEVAESSTRRLRIAAVTTAAESFVPPQMQAFSRPRAGRALTLDVGNRQDVLHWVRAHRVDVAITGRPPHDERLLSDPIAENRIVCITAPDDPAASRGPAAALALAGRRWLLREPGSGTRELNERFLADQDIVPETLTLGSNGAIKQAARAGLGVSLLSRESVEWELDSGRLGEIELTEGPPARCWFLLRSSVGPERAGLESFIDFVHHEFGPSPGAGPSGPGPGAEPGASGQG